MRLIVISCGINMIYAVHYGPSCRGNCGITLQKVSFSLSLPFSSFPARNETRLANTSPELTFLSPPYRMVKNAYRASSPFIFQGVNFLANFAKKLNSNVGSSYGRLDFARNWESSCLVNFLTFSFDLYPEGSPTGWNFHDIFRDASSLSDIIGRE